MPNKSTVHLRASIIERQGSTLICKVAFASIRVVTAAEFVIWEEMKSVC